MVPIACFKVLSAYTLVLDTLTLLNSVSRSLGACYSLSLVYGFGFYVIFAVLDMPVLLGLGFGSLSLPFFVFQKRNLLDFVFRKRTSRFLF